MRIDAYRGSRRGLRLLAAVAVLGISAVACGGAPAMGGVGNGGQAATSTCGEGTGLKAGGTPVKLGGIVTALQGEDFTPITTMARGYFNCVNDNGGINGHPIEYTVENDQGNPAVAQADATDLIEKQGILAMVGNTSIVDCGANHTYYEQHGFDVVGASLEDTCHTTPNYATVNMGPNYSTQGAVQYVVSKGANNVVIDTAALGGAGAAQVQWGIDYAHSKGLTARIDLDDTPIGNPAAVAKRVVQEAGPGGAVVLNFTTPEGLKVLQGAEQQGLVNSVRAWGWSTPGNDASVAQALDGAWNGKLGVNAELNLTNATGPDSTLYRQVVRQYAPSVALGSFSQMGFLMAEILTQVMLKLPDDELTPKAVNEAIRSTKNFKTDILCKPWYFGNADVHAPNNTDRTVTPENHVMVETQGCFQIAPVPANNLAAIRADEQREHLNTE